MDRKQADEIKMVNHMYQVLEGKLTGRNHKDPIYESPLDAVLAGVVFPEETFLRDRTQVAVDTFTSSDDDEDDTSVRYTTRKAQASRRLVSLGMEFRAKPMHELKNITLEVSAHIGLYVRLYPTLAEQQGYENVGGFAEQDEQSLEDPAEDNPETPSQAETNPTSAELHELAYKFQRIEVNVPTFKITVNDQLSDGDIQAFNDVVNEALTIERESVIKKFGDQLVSTRDDTQNVSKKRKRPDSILVQGTWHDQKSFDDAIHKTHGTLSLPNWCAGLHVIPGPDPENENGVRHLIVALVNKTTTNGLDLHPTEFFDVRLKVEIINGEISPMKFHGVSQDYRRNLSSLGLGIGCVVREESDKVLVTETMPCYFQKWYRTSSEIKANFDEVSSNPLQVLSAIKVNMYQYIGGWDAFISNNTWDTEEGLNECIQDRKAFVKEVESFSLGIQVLQRDSNLMTAFQLMNQVFLATGMKATPPIVSWRLFQIVYIVRLLASLAARESSEPVLMERLKEADILWFPTGGGKTEAYLGLIVCGLFYDRLRGKSRGTTAWIRFPLRMLSKQQLDRLAKVLAQAEILRCTSSKIPNTLRGEPYSMGYFVGGSNTPNFVSKKQMDKYLNENEELRKDALVLQRCPFCGSHIEMKVNESAWRLEHHCVNPKCYSVINMGGILPVYVTDSEVYRYLPSVLCGTVDKLAILGRYGEFSHIFGSVSGKCPDHGYFSNGQCIEKRYGSRSCSRTKKEYLKITHNVADPCPAFIIQDELHLLKEELGTFNGHYEGFLNKISEKVGTGKPPKIIAATATIEQYEQHTRHIYLRHAVRFPVPGFRTGENFYATSTPIVPRRLYIGLLSHLRSKEETIERCLAIYHRELQRLNRLGLDVINEIGLTCDYDEDSIKQFLGYYDLSVVYVNQKATGGDIDYRINNILNPRLASLNEGTLNTQVLTGEDSMEVVGGVIDRIESELTGVMEDKLDTLIATSMISHGVDLARINAMFLCGTPSRFAEYIQATSRSARSHAGLVLVSFNGQDVREQSLYRYFLQNHEHLDRLVDPVPVHRFAQNAIRRTIPGLMIGLLTSVYARDPQIWNKYKVGLDTVADVKKVLPDEKTSGGYLTWDRIKQDLYDIYGVFDGSFPISLRQIAKAEISEQVDKLRGTIMRSDDMELKSPDLLNPLSSFRDIDAGIDFTTDTDTAVIQNWIGN
jgi:hypothetical protein